MNPEDRKSIRIDWPGLWDVLMVAAVPLALALLFWFTLMFSIKVHLAMFFDTPEGDYRDYIFGAAMVLGMLGTVLLVAVARLFRVPRQVLSRMWDEMAKPLREYRKQLDEAKKAGLKEWEVPANREGLVLCVTLIMVSAPLVLLKVFMLPILELLVWTGMGWSAAGICLMVAYVAAPLSLLVFVPRIARRLLEARHR